MQEKHVYLSDTENIVSVEDVGTEASVDETPTDEISVSETVVDDMQQFSHANLTDRTLPNQHTIASIEGLRDELDKLSFAQSHAHGGGYAQYHLWADGGISNQADRIGCFVSVVEDGTGAIKLCSNADEDVLGVIVSEQSAGFIGNSIEQNEASKYGLVCLLGTVKVRVTEEVRAGDYIVPNTLGIANGVAATESYAQTITISSGTCYSLNHTPIAKPKIHVIDDDGGIGAAVTIGDSAEGRTVALDGSVLTIVVDDDGYKVGDKLCVIYDYVNQKCLGYKVISTSYSSGVHYATISLVPNGNALYRLQSGINNALDRVAVTENNVTVAINRANDAYGLAELVSGDITTSLYEQIKESISASQNAQENANTAIESVQKAESVANEAKQEAADAKSEVESMLAENTALTEGVQSLISSVSQYTVGEYSQASGLHFKHIANILPVGVIYVPTVNHTEAYDLINGVSMVATFYREYSYRWTGSTWEESDGENVMFSGVYVVGSDAMPYWYTDSSIDVVHDNATYPKETLYVWENNKWVAVATLSGNSLSRVVSLVQQTENEIKNKIVDAQGGYASIGARISATESAIESIAKWDDAALTAIQQKADKNEASINQVAEFGHVATTWSEVDESQFHGPFYANVPEWDAKTETWVFSGDYNVDAGNIDGVDYCYTSNSSDSNSYCKYICTSDNKWIRITYIRSKTLASIQQQVDANKASIDIITEWDGDGLSDTLAEIKGQASENSASIHTIVTNVGADGTVTAASIMQSVNNDESEIGINADKIKMTGTTTFMTADGTNEDGETCIDGSRITTKSITTEQLATDAIKSKYYEAGTEGHFSKSGTLLDLDKGCIYTPNFAVSEDGKAHFAGTIQTPKFSVDDDGNAYFSGEIQTPTFSIDENGKAYFSGEIQSPSGEIGGFTIGGNSIYNEYDVSGVSSTVYNSLHMESYDKFNGTHGISMDKYLQDSDGNPINRDYVYVGTNGIGTYRVNDLDDVGAISDVSQTYMADGKLFSNDAEIAGHIVAKTGRIAGFHIGSYDSTSYITSGKATYADMIDGVYIGTNGIGLGAGKFYVTDTGKMYAKDADIEGKIVVTEGEIGGFSIKEDRITKGIEMASNDDNYIETVITGGDILISSSAKKYGGTIAGSENQQLWNLIIGPNFGVTDVGKLYAKDAKISGEITASGGFIGQVSITETGLGIENEDGNSFVTGNYIGSQRCSFNTGAINGWRFENNGIMGKYRILTSGLIDYNVSAATSSSNVYYAQFLPDKLVTQESPTNNVQTTQYIEWGSLTNLTFNSDERLKNSIEALPDEYDVFFDMLRPKRYKYNDGTSNRYHTGYIAQEVVQALEESGLSTSDFAAVMLRHPGTVNEKWQLRRDEFVSLNTWQIQKLKTRITELENKVKLLTSRNE